MRARERVGPMHVEVRHAFVSPNQPPEANGNSLRNERCLPKPGAVLVLAFVPQRWPAVWFVSLAAMVCPSVL